MGKQKFLLTLAMTVLLFVVSSHDSQTASAQNANLSGNWNLGASITVSSPPEFNCSFLTGFGDPVIPVTQSGSDLFAFDTDTGGQQFTLQGTVIGNLVDFTITGSGITPGTGGCSLAARNFSTQYSGELNANTQTVTGTVFGSAEYVFQFDVNGNPIFTVVTWTGTFTVEVSEVSKRDISVRVFKSTHISLPHNTSIALPFDSERWDTDNMHDPVVNPSRLTARRVGKYFIFSAREVWCQYHRNPRGLPARERYHQHCSRTRDGQRERDRNIRQLHLYWHPLPPEC